MTKIHVWPARVWDPVEPSSHLQLSAGDGSRRCRARSAETLGKLFTPTSPPGLACAATAAALLDVAVRSPVEQRPLSGEADQLAPESVVAEHVRPLESHLSDGLRQRHALRVDQVGDGQCRRPVHAQLAVHQGPAARRQRLVEEPTSLPHRNIYCT